MCFLQNFAAQMAGGFDEKAGGAQMGVMQGPMVRSKLCVYLSRRVCVSTLLYLARWTEPHYRPLNGQI